jgi:hypothetical protein
MFGTKKSELIKGLDAVRRRVCCYTGDPCDCKFGAYGDEAKGAPVYFGEQTGCPEIRQAATLLAAMSEDEFRRLCERANVSVFEYDPIEPVQHNEPCRNFFGEGFDD